MKPPPELFDSSCRSERPDGTALLHFKSTQTLLLGWDWTPDTIRDALPAGLEPVLQDGRAWLGIAFSHIRGARASLLPPVPGLSRIDCISLRTHVRCGQARGLFVFSLDARGSVLSALAHAALGLPCFRAVIRTRTEASANSVHARRVHQGANPAEFACEWTPTALGDSEAKAPAGSLATSRRDRVFFHRKNRLMYFDLWHSSEVVRPATLLRLETNLTEAAGFGTSDATPTAWATSSNTVLVWSPIPAEETLAAGDVLPPALAPDPTS
jgi:uncharacterized protein YqjF (DUF2071 family)